MARRTTSLFEVPSASDTLRRAASVSSSMEKVARITVAY
jgi:hypothetical protein